MPLKFNESKILTKQRVLQGLALPKEKFEYEGAVYLAKRISLEQERGS